MGAVLTPLPGLSVNPAACEAVFPEYVPIDQIGVNEQRLGMLAILGGFEPEVTVDYYHGATSKHIPLFAGVNSIASGAVVSVVPGAARLVQAIRSEA